MSTNYATNYAPLVHFKPGQDAEAFDKLSLHLVEEAAAEIERWMTGIEAWFGLPRHNDTDQLVQDLDSELGVVTRKVSSNPNRQ